ncbi:MAG: 16S rRNA (adenine(1518)-N(6)/adenine(1519)-N(6))-dimethyltransferase RsmA [Acidobacteriota bacterium]|jgi:16S rRNA (adenine1518-N6/adenine1519-N6)-dimethyltransferase|nr:16S rRNA (adenine(1518)-N(6)/adenine(1519)-N(6))-dimethyltransferase RsmA [Acidobacteriota bacterium]
MSKKKPNKKKQFAKKSLGQNFLVDQNIIDRIIFSLNPKKDETIIEIGAGRGALTEKLVGRAGKVFAVEIDRDLIPILREEFKDADNFHLIEQDALEIDFGSLINLQGQSRKTKLVANLPYYISTAILQYLIQYRNSFSEMVLMLQKEVVERITAEAGTKERGFLTVLIEAYFQTEKLFDVPPNSFRPIPKVTSSVVRLITKEVYINKAFDEELFRELVSLGFMQKRKTILNNLKNASGNLHNIIEKISSSEELLSRAGIEPQRRAETILLDEWIYLTDILSKNI